MNIIGIDCAAQDKNTGLALATYDGDRQMAHVIVTKVGDKDTPIADVVVGWLKGCDEPTLLALDAPLGWPFPLQQALATHMAGEPIAAPAREIFFRKTDQQVWEDTTKKPLEIGATWIAWTAHGALRLLGEVRQKSGRAIPLVWDCKKVSQTCAIEVYPAGTLQSVNLGNLVEHGDMKLSQSERARMKKVRAVRKLHLLQLNDVEPIDEKSSHELDAIICVAASVDFLQGYCTSPNRQQMNLARKEGWIWVRKRDI